VSDLVEVEFVSAVSRKVRDGELAREDGERIVALFTGHLSGAYVRIPLDRGMYDVAKTWIGRFDLPLRTLDALHLAVASTHGLTFATSDVRLARSARSLGISVRHIRAARSTSRAR